MKCKEYSLHEKTKSNKKLKLLIFQYAISNTVQFYKTIHVVAVLISRSSVKFNLYQYRFFSLSNFEHNTKTSANY